jgi:hypothetical protein
MNLLCQLFFGDLVPMPRAQAQDGPAQAGLRHRPSDTVFCFTLGGHT